MSLEATLVLSNSATQPRLPLPNLENFDPNIQDEIQATVVYSPEVSPEKAASSGVKRSFSMLTPSPSKQDHYKKLKNALGQASPVVRPLFKEITKEQTVICTNGHLAFEHPATEHVPSMIVTGHNVHLLTKKIGQGAQASAYLSETVPDGPKSPYPTVLKVAKKPFSPQKKLLEGIQNRGGIDVIGDSGALISQKFSAARFGVFERSSGDLTNINYASESFEASYGKPPVAFITSQLISIAKSIQDIHIGKKLHRDIKGANLLFNVNGPGKVTDFDLLIKAPKEGVTHSVGMTPHYAAPFIWADVTQQRVIDKGRLKSIGHQSKESDLFALGVTLERDVLVRMIRGLSKKHGIKNPLDLSPVNVEEPFTDEEMLKIDAEHSGRVIYRFPDLKAKKRGFLMKFPTREEAHAKILDAIFKTEGHHPEKELEGLKILLRLAYDLQDPSPKKTLSSAEVIKVLEGIATSLGSL